METSDSSLTQFQADFARDIAHGLSKQPKELYTKYIYDDDGSRLFEQIMQLDEYYPTRCEKAIFNNHKDDIAYYLGDSPANVVELGAGNGEKTYILLQHFLESGKSFSFWPLDISELAINRLKEVFSESLPELDYQGLVADYFDGLAYLNKQAHTRNLVLFLGGNIGNFLPEDRAHFLEHLKSNLNPGDLVLIGFDLKKMPEILNKAYNDKEGVTEAFNFNMLKRINRELDGDFDINKFQFNASYNVFEGAVESSLVAHTSHSVRIGALDQTFTFDDWEPIHTESSYKFSIQQIRQLADKHGFKEKALFTDPEHFYVNMLWEA